jgi:hypothetical protein
MSRSKNNFLGKGIENFASFSGREAEREAGRGEAVPTMREIQV